MQENTPIQYDFSPLKQFCKTHSKGLRSHDIDRDSFRQTVSAIL